MVVLTSISLALVLAAVGAFLYGTVQISRYAFRISTGRGLAALLFPPYTFYFAFYELDEEGKEGPAASWAFGLIVGTALILLFSHPLQLLVTGQLDQLRAEAPGEAAAAECERAETDEEPEAGDEEPESESVPAEEPDEESDEDEKEPEKDEQTAEEGSEADEQAEDSAASDEEDE